MNLRILAIATMLATCLPLRAVASSETGAVDPGMELLAASKDYKLILGTGVGLVRFDVKAKVTDKQDNIGIFVDLEGNLGLEEESNIALLYGAYRFNADHSVLFGYFDINRRSLIDFDEAYGDLLDVNATLEVRDDTRFFYASYGYTLFLDEKSKITLVAGIHALDLRFSAEASGELTVEEETQTEELVESADVFAPLPLIGLNFSTYYTPEWSVSTRLAVIGGRYEDVSAGVLQVNIFSRYQMSKHVGLLLGLGYFSAEVDIEDSEELTEVSYGYEGAWIGLHFGL